MKNSRDLRLIYANQCPYIGKSVAELPPVAERFGIPLKRVEVTDAQSARKLFPTPYGMFCLSYDGKLLADHPVSATRFKNILQKELGFAETT